MLKTIVGVVVGYLAWSALWLGGNALLFAEESDIVAQGGTLTETGPLATLLALSILCSVVAGVLCAKLTPTSPGRPVFTLGVLLLTTGVLVQMDIWDAMPVWYHLSFLILLLPMVRLGGRLGAKQGR